MVSRTPRRKRFFVFTRRRTGSNRSSSRRAHLDRSARTMLSCYFFVSAEFFRAVGLDETISEKKTQRKGEKSTRGQTRRHRTRTRPSGERRRTEFSSKSARGAERTRDTRTLGGGGTRTTGRASALGGAPCPSRTVGGGGGGRAGGAARRPATCPPPRLFLSGRETRHVRPARRDRVSTPLRPPPDAGSLSAAGDYRRGRARAHSLYAASPALFQHFRTPGAANTFRAAPPVVYGCPRLRRPTRIGRALRLCLDHTRPGERVEHRTVRICRTAVSITPLNPRHPTRVSGVLAQKNTREPHRNGTGSAQTGEMFFKWRMADGARRDFGLWAPGAKCPKHFVQRCPLRKFR